MSANSLGWVKLHRSICDWGWRSDPNTMHLFINLLIDANIKDGEFMGVQVPRGSLIFGFFVYSKKLGLSVRQLRTALNHLKATSEVTIKTTNKFSIISITNWDEYQGDDKQNDKRPTNDRQRTDN